MSSFAISQGFGKAGDLLPIGRASQVEKMIVCVVESAVIVENLTFSSQILFAARLLFILTVALTKCSVTLLLARITPVKKHLFGCYTLLTLCGLWGLASFIAEATHCLPRQPWVIAQPGCSDFVCHFEINKSKVWQLTRLQLLGWQAITALDITIEVLLAAMPVWIVWDLQTHWTRKANVVFIFALRLL